MTNSHSIWVKFTRYTPVVVRLLARKGPTLLMSDAEIVTNSLGRLTLADVKRLSYLKTWDEVTIGQMRSFCLACGVDFANRETMRKLNRYIKNPGLLHLKPHLRNPEVMNMLKEFAHARA